jgi:hypothetical protein
MLMLLKQLLLQSKALLGGASSTSISGLDGMIPNGFFDMSLFTQTTTVFGFAVPTYLLYLVLCSDD